MRVLLAPSEVPSNYPRYWDKLVFPLLGSPKLDGIRALSDSGALMSRSWKPIPSYQAQELFTSVPWLDGELIEGVETDFGVFNRTQSHVMSENKPGNLSFHIFDYADPDFHNEPFYKRHMMAEKAVSYLGDLGYKIVPHVPLESMDELLAYEETQLELGFEGIMLRTFDGRYKTGRATINEGIIYKLKRFQDAEGVVVGFVERETNNNPKERDERGYAKRSSAKAGKVGADTLGKFKVLYNGEIINVAPGVFTHEELQEIWDNKANYIQRILKFRFFAHGVKDAPRHARALGWRHEFDL